MKLALIGATGRIGSKILAEALDRGHTVAGIARHTDTMAPRAGLRPIACDLADEGALSQAISGCDAVIVSVDWAKVDMKHVYAACRQAGVKRVVMVGGASSLERTPGVRMIDEPDFPANLMPIVGPAADGLERARAITDLDWTFVSPSLTIEPGERTGKFRLATDQLLVAADGSSRISQEDFAIAILDEIESPQYIRRRFTAGY